MTATKKVVTQTIEVVEPPRPKRPVGTPIEIVNRCREGGKDYSRELSRCPDCSPPKPVKLTIVYTCPLCKGELPAGGNVCKSKDCDFGKPKGVRVIYK